MTILLLTAVAVWKSLSCTLSPWEGEQEVRGEEARWGGGGRRRGEGRKGEGKGEGRGGKVRDGRGKG